MSKARIIYKLPTLTANQEWCCERGCNVTEPVLHENVYSHNLTTGEKQSEYYYVCHFCKTGLMIWDNSINKHVDAAEECYQEPVQSIKPALIPCQVIRDSYGMFRHPNLSAAIKLHLGNKEFYTHDELTNFANSQNIELRQVHFEEDASEDLQDKYYGEDDQDISDWNPSPPDDQIGWFIISIYENEDGPICWWAKRLEPVEGGSHE